ncbi:PREDICTED: 16 kDa beta-galactoside-binding lectin [Mesitornis unicolor]|nr:PREDICTED: 16 kDa beta-galactoside-binding lectin [Mesitornis unicolor]
MAQGLPELVGALGQINASGLALQGLVVTQLDVQPGECVKVKGKIKSDAKGFAVNVGKDSSTLMLHFNPRFDCHGDVNTIVCNSKQDGTWGEEDRKADFPFQLGDKIEICISFNETEVTVKLPEAEFQFPNRLGMEKIEYLAVEGDFKVKAIKFS